MTTVRADPIPGDDDPFPVNGTLEFDLTGIGVISFPVISPSSRIPIIRRSTQVGSQIDIELLSMELVGTAGPLGAMSTRIGSDMDVEAGASLGQINNVVQNLNMSFQSGDAFFDIFFEADIPDSGQTAYSRDPLRMEASISALPPLGQLFVSTGSVEVFLKTLGADSSAGDPSGGTIERLEFTAIPEPSSLLLCGIAAAALVGLGYRRRKRAA